MNLTYMGPEVGTVTAERNGYIVSVIGQRKIWDGYIVLFTPPQKKKKKLKWCHRSR
jgi:hypothetical protein